MWIDHKNKHKSIDPDWLNDVLMTKLNEAEDAGN